MPTRHLFSILFLLLFATAIFAQEADTTADKKVNLFALPVAYYTPETTWAFGALGVLTYAVDSIAPRSQVQLGLAYTLQNQLLIYLPFQFYLKEDRLRLTGEVGYYRYSYFFYGIGNTFDDFEGELYNVNYPRLRLNALKRLDDKQFVGLRYVLDAWDVYDQVEDGLLAKGDIIGSEASTYSAIGPVWQWDSRDHVFFPTRGMWLEASLLTSTGLLGASQNFTKWTFDARKYKSFKNENHVLAGQVYWEANSGAPPFNQLALLGGGRTLRGYYEGRFRDRQMILTQLEYRFPIYKRIAGVAFASAGSVTDKWSNWQSNYFRYAFGAGLRFMLLPEDKIRIRFDVGAGPGSTAFYFTVGEAF